MSIGVERTMVRVNINLLMSLLMLVGIVPAVSAADGNPVKGQSLTSTCVACHGKDGNSIAGSFPNIAGQGENYLYKQMTEIQSGVRAAPLMAGILDNMSDQDLKDLAAYYAGQTAAAGAAKADLAAQGEEIYRAGIARKQIAACTACHSPTGQGNDPAGFPALKGQWPEYTIAQLKAFRSGERMNDGDSKMMRLITLDMSDPEIEAVASYLRGLR